jgi:hypothetical protein
MIDEIIGILRGAREEETTALGGSSGEFAGSVAVTIAESRGVIVET